MKKLYFLLMMVLAVATAWSQTTRTWNGGSGAWNVPGNWSTGVIPQAGDRILFNDGSAGTITNVPTLSVSDITISNATEITFQHTSAATLTITNGNSTDLNIDANSILTIGNNVNVTLANNAEASIAGKMIINSGRTFNTDGSGNPNQRPTTKVTSTGSIQNNGTVVSTNSARLSFAGGAKYIHTLNGGTVPTASWDIASLCDIAGMSSNYPDGMDQGFGNIIFSSTLTGNVEMSENLNCQNLTIAIGGGNELRGTFNNQNRTITVGGKFTLASGKFVLDNSNGGSQLNVARDFELSGGTLANNGSSSAAVIFTGSAVQVFTKAATAIISGNINFTINSNAKVDFGTSVLNGTSGNFSLRDGAKLITAHANGINSNGASGSIQVGGTRSFSDDADYEFRGANTGIFNTGNSGNTTASFVRNLTINNASGPVTLSKPITIGVGLFDLFASTKRLYLQNGVLRTTASNILTLNNFVQATGVAALTANQYNNASFIEGPVKKVGISEFTFPVGKIGTGLMPVSIEATFGVSTNSFVAEYKRETPPNKDNIVAPGIKRISNCEYWILDRDAGGTDPFNVTLYWNANSSCDGGPYVTVPNTIRAVHFDGTKWDTRSDGVGSGTSSAGSVRWGGVTTFSPFTLGTTDIIANPLPVVFANVKAYEKNSGVQVEWSNMTEKDVAGYTIERSANGKDFASIGEQLPTSNQDDRANYTAFDASPVNGVNYYRIKAVETTGKIVYSKVLSVNLGSAAGKGLNVYPNPVSGNQVTVSLSNIKKGQYNLRVVNTAGQDVHKQVISNHSSMLTQTIDLPATVKPGVYSLVITGADYRQSKLFIVQ